MKYSGKIVILNMDTGDDLYQRDLEFDEIIGELLQPRPQQHNADLDAAIVDAVVESGLLDQDPIPTPSVVVKQYKCGKCGGLGHSRKTCPYGEGTKEKEAQIDLLSKKEYADAIECKKHDMDAQATANEMNVPVAEVVKAYKSNSYEQYYAM